MADDQNLGLLAFLGLAPKHLSCSTFHGQVKVLILDLQHSKLVQLCETKKIHVSFVDLPFLVCNIQNSHLVCAGLKQFYITNFSIHRCFHSQIFGSMQSRGLNADDIHWYRTV